MGRIQAGETCLLVRPGQMGFGGAVTLRLTVIGTGYVGLNTGVAAAYLGHDVVCVDKDQRKLELLNSGKSPIHEQGLDELFAQVRDRMRFTRIRRPRSGTPM